MFCAFYSFALVIDAQSWEPVVHQADPYKLNDERNKGEADKNESGRLIATRKGQERHEALRISVALAWTVRWNSQKGRYG